MSWSSSDARVELIARFTALPGREDEVAHLLLAFMAKVQKEPGCLAFEPSRVAAPPAGSGLAPSPEPVGMAFVVAESYRDEAAFAAHLTAPYAAVFNDTLGPLIKESSSQLTFLAPLGRPLHAGAAADRAR
jgi:quinol monooxygenase YgiN